MRSRRSLRRGFNLVELLIVIIIIGALMAVAVPSLLNSRDSAGNSAAKQQLTAAATEIQTKMLRTNALPADNAALQTIVNQIQIVAANTPAGDKATDGAVKANALTVSASVNVAVPNFVVLIAKGADGICWAVKVNLREKSFGKYGTPGTARDCMANDATGAATISWNKFGFPEED